MEESRKLKGGRLDTLERMGEEKLKNTNGGQNDVRGERKRRLPLYVFSPLNK